MEDVLLSKVEKAIRNFYKGSSVEKNILIAVSGGADSIALLLLINSLKNKLNLNINVVTINHRIRSEKESAGDTLFVENFCNSFEPKIPCTVVDLKVGEVAKTALLRKKGEEDAARFLRYRVLEEQANLKKSNCICTGHTQDDQLETVLMRFLQGSGIRGLRGIEKKRKHFLRPILNCNRIELEHYLKQKNITWKDDSTNLDKTYYRNKVRHVIIPLLNAQFQGWDKAVLKGVEKNKRDFDAFVKLRKLPQWNRVSDAKIECNLVDFSNLHPSLKLEMLYEGLNLLDIKKRISYSFLSKISDCKTTKRFSSSGIDFYTNGNKICFELTVEHRTKTGYLFYVEKTGSLITPGGRINIETKNNKTIVNGETLNAELPFVIRSRKSEDFILGANEKNKKIVKLYKDWQVNESQRNLIPIIEKDGVILAVLGKLFGYKNFLIKKED